MACLSKTISMRVFCRSGCKKCVHMPNLLEPTTWCAFNFFLLFVYLKLFSFVCLFIYLFMYLFFSHWQGHITHCRNSSRQKKKLISSFTYPNVFQTCMTDFSGFLKTNLVTHLHIMKANVWKTHSHVIFQVFWHHTTVWWKDRNLISPQKSLLKILTSAMCFFLWSSVLLCQTFQWISLIS